MGKSNYVLTTYIIGYLKKISVRACKELLTEVMIEK